jgi:hypothetical protein
MSSYPQSVILGAAMAFVGAQTGQADLAVRQPQPARNCKHRPRYLLFAPGSKVFMNSEIALACASLIPDMALL